MIQILYQNACEIITSNLFSRAAAIMFLAGSHERASPLTVSENSRPLISIAFWNLSSGLISSVLFQSGFNEPTRALRWVPILHLKQLNYVILQLHMRSYVKSQINWVEWFCITFMAFGNIQLKCVDCLDLQSFSVEHGHAIVDGVNFLDERIVHFSEQMS